MLAHSLNEERMAMGDAHDLLHDLIIENVRDGEYNEVACIRCMQEAYLDALYIDEIAGPASTHVTQHPSATEEQRQARTILYDTTKPVEEQLDVERSSFLHLFELFKFIKGNNKHAIDLFNRLLYF